MGRGMLVIFWLLALGLLTWGFGNWEHQQINPNSNPISSENAQYREVILDSNRQHHYVANGQINGQSVTFLLDTGATDVVIPAKLANELGLKRGRAATAYTANGSVRVYATELDNLQLGSIRLRNVRASINPGMDGDGVLLGMSALRSIDFQQRNGQLILRQDTRMQ
ncbi:TIGR02281 family clan AA aspartic protease [Aestuariicella sp. G3-2]|nr:TIGR02281 family clan AA aspartic protease [Aestuariicella albida]